MRQTFENWYSDGGKFPRAIERDGEGYRLKHAHDSWTSWKVAAAITAASCAEIAKTWANKTTDNVNRARYLEIEKAIKGKFGLEL